MVDLHKFLALAKAVGVTDGGNQASLELLDGFKVIIAMTSSCSPRVNLMLRSSTRMRTEGLLFQPDWTEPRETVQPRETFQVYRVVLCYGHINFLFYRMQDTRLPFTQISN